MRSSASLGHPPLQWSRMCVGVTARLQQIEFEVLDWGIYEHENIGLKYFWKRKYWIEILGFRIMGTTRCEGVEWVDKRWWSRKQSAPVVRFPLTLLLFLFLPTCLSCSAQGGLVTRTSHSIEEFWFHQKRLVLLLSFIWLDLVFFRWTRLKFIGYQGNLCSYRDGVCRQFLLIILYILKS